MDEWVVSIDGWMGRWDKHMDGWVGGWIIIINLYLNTVITSKIETIWFKLCSTCNSCIKMLLTYMAYIGLIFIWI